MFCKVFLLYKKIFKFIVTEDLVYIVLTMYKSTDYQLRFIKLLVFYIDTRNKT